MKKLLTFLTLLTLSIGVGWANDATFSPSDFSGQGTSGTGSAISATVDGVTFACNKGYGTTQIRCYSGGTITISSDNTITGISFTFSGSYTGGLETSYTGLSTKSWERTLSSQARITSVTVTYTTGSSQITEYDVTCNSAENGSISVGSTTSYAEGATVTVTATPQTGYKLSTVTVTPSDNEVSAPDVTISGNSATFTMPASDVEVDATFEETLAVQYKLVEDENDLVSGAEYLLVGSTNTAPYSGILGDISSNIGSVATTGFTYNSSEKTITVEDNCSATPLTLGGSAGAWTLHNGTAYLSYTGSNNNLYAINDATAATAKWIIYTDVFPSSKFLIANANSTSRYIAYNSGTNPKRFACYTGTGLNSVSPISLFKKVETGDYTITIDDAIENGTVTASRESANANDPVTVTVTPEPGYELSTLTVDGTDVTSSVSNNSYTFNMPAHSVTITATFALKKNKVEYTVSPANTGEVWLTSGTTYDQSLGYSYSTMGTTVGIALAAYPGYDVNSLTITDEGGATVSYTTYNSEWNDGKWVTYYTFVMPATPVNIAATFKSGDIYILGTANDNPWNGNKGVKMTFDAGTNTYSANVYFATTTDTGKGQFSFASNLSGNDGDWNNIGKRWGAPSQDYDLVTNANGGNWTENNSDPNRFAVPYGVYEIKVNWGTGLVTATKKDITVTLDKASGQLETGTTVNVASNLSTLLQGCKSGVSATLAYSTDDGASYTDGNSFVVNSNMTAKGKAYYGTIEAESDAYDYTVVTHYPVTATANPTAGGTVSVSPASALAGETVTITASPKSGYLLESITVNGTAIEPNEGVYSFTMPAQATEVVANFSKIQYAITKAETKCTIDITDGVTVTDGNITAGAGDLVKFTVTPISNKYYVSSVTLVWGDGTTTTTPALTDGVYSFNMQARPVTITAVCEREAVGDGSFVLVTDATTLNAGDKVIITNSKTVGSETSVAMSTTQNTNNRGEAQVTIVDGPKITPSDNVQIFTLEGDANGWYFYTGSGYIYAASSSSNHLKTEVTKDDNAKAAISISNDIASIIFQGTNTRNVLQYNSGSSIFSCYGSASQSPVYIYKQTAAGLMVEIDPDGGEVIGSQEVTIDANVEGAMVQYKIGEGEWSTPAEAPVTTTITGNVGDQVVVYAKATMEDEDETLEDETSSIFTFVAPNVPTITPASCNISSETQNVTITSNYDNGTIEYSTDGGTTWNAYTGQFHVIIEGVGESATVQARVTVNGVTSEVASATYTRGVQPVVFSPARGTYYGDQTCQMFSTTKGARIYYTDDGSDPVMNQGTTKLYTNEIEMTSGNTYNFKAVAYIGTTPSAVTTADYTIKQKSEYVSNNNKLYSVAELNAVNVPLTSPYYTTDNYEMVNPVQVIYMSTYKQNGYQPEFCLIRDNTGYGMIYFGKQNSAHNNFKVFDMGDWIGGGYSGQVSNFYDPNQQVLSDTHPELGRSGSGQHIFNWVTSAMSNSAVLPEYLTISEIQSSGTDDNPDYWGHYVHLRKTTVELVQSTDPGNYTTGQDKDGKWSGTITDEDGQSIMYYDKFYLQCNEGWTLNNNLFKGHPNRTFDVYGFVACYKNVYQISPFDFAWIDKPVINKETTTYYEPQTVTINSEDDPTATIWYKTSEMDDFHVYTEPFEVNSTTTVEWYATKQSQYNDELESKRGTITMTFEEIAKPVITPESQVKAVGESVDASIAFETDKTNGAEIVYTTDGSDPKTSETAQVYTLGTTMNFTTTTTVRAITRVGSGDRYLYSAEADAKTYTFVKSNGIEYTLIDDVTKLKENGVYVIVSQDYSEAMSTTQNVNNRGAAGVLFVEGTNKAKVYGNDDVAQFTLSVLTHDEDTSPERHFLMQTNNSNVNGYLYVGHDVNNSLMTEAEEDAMGNDVAVITIDSDGRAHIHFNYAGGDNRYLQYWNRDRLFNTYKTEYDDRAVYIYGVEATPLATIEKEGKSGQDYTVADELVGVYFDQSHPYLLWCKDQGNVSIAKSNLAEGEIDFLHDVVDQNKFAAWEDCDQSNWVILDFSGVTGVHNDPEEFLGKYIAPASITGTYTKDTNYKIALKQAPTLNEGSASYTNNVYVATNFVATYQNPGYNGRRVLNPKGTEVHTITYAVWNGSGFSTPETTDMPGSITVDWTYNANPDIAEDLIVNSIYEFTATVGLASTTPSGVPGLKVKEPIPATGYVLQPLDLSTDKEMDPTTGISGITNGKAVKSIKYVNVAGIVSDVPFQGVNIVVTEYTDGSRTTSKMLRK